MALPDDLRHGRGRRAVARTVVGLAGLHALYLVVGNVGLNSPPARQFANRQPEKLVASWSRAVTLYPGHFRVTGLKLAGHVRRTVWSVQADEVRGRVALLPLLAGELRVPRALAHGVAGGASLIDTVRPPPPPRPGGWTVRFDRIEADGVRQAYFQDFVLRGDGRATVGFVKVLRGGPMEVLPSSGRFDRATAWRDGTKLLRDASLAARFSVARHRYEEAPGIRKLEKTALAVDATATTAGVLVRGTRGQRPSIEWSEGPGTLRASLGWESGAVAPGGTLTLVLPVRSELDGTPRTTSATADVRTTEDGARITASLEPVHDDSLHLASEFAVAGRTVPLADAGALVRRTSGHVSGRWHFESLAWLAALLPPAVPIALEGSGVVRADLRIRDGVVTSGSVLEAPHVAAAITALGNRFAGDARARLVLEPAAGGAIATRLEARLDRFTVEPLDDPGQPYVHGSDLYVEARSTAAADGKLGEDAHGRVTFADARVPDVRVYNRYLPRTPVRLTGGEARLAGDLRFDRDGGVATGRLALDGRGIEAAVGSIVLGGDLGVDLRLQRADLHARRFDAAGSRVRFERARVASADETVADAWWCEIVLDDARLDWDRPLALDSRLRLRMKDVAPLLGLYASRRHLPAWVGRIVDAGEARAEGRVRWADDTLLLEPLSARNERFGIEARLRLHDRQPAGDLLATWGAASVGVEVDGATRHYHLADARDWFQGRSALAPAPPGGRR